MRIVGVLTPSGTFPSWVGGNRPTFGHGISVDRQRSMTGRVDVFTLNGNQGGIRNVFGTTLTSGRVLPAEATSEHGLGYILFGNINATPIGNDNASVTASSIKWRRVS